MSNSVNTSVGTLYQRHLLAVLALSIAIALPRLAQAQTAYTTETGFLAAVSQADSESFSDLLVGDLPTSLTRLVGTHGYTVSGLDDGGQPVGLLAVTGIGTGIGLSTNSAYDAIVFNAFGAGLRGIGGSFFAATASGDFQLGGLVVLTVVDAQGGHSYSLDNTSPSGFFGLVFDSPISSLSVSAPNVSGNAFGFPTVQGLLLGNSVGAVPEPASALLLLGGLLALVCCAPRGLTLSCELKPQLRVWPR